jgi:hypothetical protein
VILSELKSAMASVPLAMAPLDQLLLADQSPPLVVSIHVPLVADAERTAARPHKSASQILIHGGRTRRRPDTRIAKATHFDLLIRSSSMSDITQTFSNSGLIVHR